MIKPDMNLKVSIPFEERFPFLNTDILQARILWSIRLRWFAICGYLLVTTAVFYFTDININYKAIWYLLGGLSAVNLLYYVVQKIWKDYSFRAELFMLHVHIVFDLLFLVVVLHVSGGIENPAFLFFIFHAVLSSILFSRLSAFIYSLFIIFLFSTLVLLESNFLIPHYLLFDPHIYSNHFFVLLTIAVFGITIFSTTYICTGFMKIYRNSKRIIDRQNRRLIEADRQKTSFFQFASHELKSPVIAVKSTIDVILKGYSGAIDLRTVTLLQKAGKRAEQMLDMITELLELTHIRSEAVKEDTENINMHMLISENVHQESEVAEQKGQTFELNLQAENPIIQTDRSDMEKILGNLIGNAIRYGKKEGWIRLHTYNKNNKLYIAVEDNGIGIDSNELKNIFKEFYRSPKAKKIVYFGTGLGLSLVKQLIEKHHGNIRVKSEEGKGSSFEMVFPQNGSKK